MTPEKSANIMTITAWSFIAFSAIWALAPYEAINQPAIMLIDLLDWPFGDASPALNQSQMWLSSIGAGLTFAMAIMLLGVVVPGLRNANRSVIRTTILAFSIWYIVDSIGSIASGVASNAFFNTIFLAMVLVPLVMVRFED